MTDWHFGVNNNAFTSYDLREDGSTSATPVAGDRFFFTDENQPGDPVRYVQYRDLEAAFRKYVPTTAVFWELSVSICRS